MVTGIGFPELVATSAAAFVAAHFDDMLVVLALFASGVPFQTILAGEFAGFAGILLAASGLSLGSRLVGAPCACLLGVIPIALGLWRLRTAETAPRPGHSGTTVLAIATSTFARGGDDVAVYGPLLIGRSAVEMALAMGVCGALVALWCVAAPRLANVSAVASAFDSWGPRLAPFVFVGLGVYVLATGGAWRVFAAE